MSTSSTTVKDAERSIVLAYIAKGPQVLPVGETGDTTKKLVDYLKAASQLIGLKRKERTADATSAVKRVRTEPVAPADVVDDDAVDTACALLERYPGQLGHEHVGDSSLLSDPRVWDAMLTKMPMTALVRNLGRVTSLGLLGKRDREADIAARLSDQNAVKKARLHPIQLLEAHRIYRNGKGDKGSLTWSPSAAVTAAIERAFYLSFKNVESTGLRYLFGIDVSGSMEGATVCGMDSLNCREAAAAMFMALLRTEPAGNVKAMVFAGGFTELRATASMSLEEVYRIMQNLGNVMNGTDCAQPIIYALRHRIPVDVFVIFTDNETYYGNVHPTKALEMYRTQMNMPHVKLAVLAFSASEFSIADPEDPRMMDIAGLDSAVPRILRDFALGRI